LAFAAMAGGWTVLFLSLVCGVPFPDGIGFAAVFGVFFGSLISAGFFTVLLLGELAARVWNRRRC
jgi:hypothetical protein